MALIIPNFVLYFSKENKSLTERSIHFEYTWDWSLSILFYNSINHGIRLNRYLIVIDDVWTIRAWDAIQSILLLQENNSYSRIIVTTRIETVAKACSPAIAGQHFIHQMQRLKTFGNKECPKELASTTDKILRRCAGLPLAIVSIANVLAGYTSAENKYKWESIYNSMGSQMESNPTLEGMKQIITLSYNHLSHELKSCMLYLSIFPEDYEIDKHRLCRWIAEGLVMERRGLTLMEVAESYLDELVSRNMIEVIVSKSLESNFVSLLGGQYARLSYGRILRLSIQRGNNDRRPSQDTEPQQSRKNKVPRVHGIEAMDVKHVRSLSMFQHQGKNLLDHKFTLLRVLDLEGCEGISDHHMKYVCGLYLLKFLNLRGTNIRQVPPEINKLEHLQTLDVRDTRVEGLPDTVKELHNLERLQISHSSC
ncbi:hypothetical protein HU200_043414 [Digitaria exilis]|uniref:NB-ARC domain-containing protein n=1 Tax=Digitaria exilis TaxID=1010633 RepID=A0A835EC16_9POAL|nr:hypothetical protein HU200_043414 [Digitaria exilis]